MAGYRGAGKEERPYGRNWGGIGVGVGAGVSGAFAVFGESLENDVGTEMRLAALAMVWGVISKLSKEESAKRAPSLCCLWLSCSENNNVLPSTHETGHGDDCQSQQC